MFGKPRQLKKLGNDLVATKLSFLMFDQMPEHNRNHFMENGPRSLEENVRKAVQAGHGTAAREMVMEAAGTVPKGATAEQWAHMMRPAIAAFD